MADIDNVVTLGLTIDGAQAEATIQRVTQGLDQMGARGDAAAETVSAAGQKVTASLQRQAQEAQRITAAMGAIAQVTLPLEQVQALDASLNAVADTSRGVAAAMGTVATASTAATQAATQAAATQAAAMQAIGAGAASQAAAQSAVTDAIQATSAAAAQESAAQAQAATAGIAAADAATTQAAAQAAVIEALQGTTVAAATVTAAQAEVVASGVAVAEAATVAAAATDVETASLFRLGETMEEAAAARGLSSDAAGGAAVGHYESAEAAEADRIAQLRAADAAVAAARARAAANAVLLASEREQVENIARFDAAMRGETLVFDQNTTAARTNAAARYANSNATMISAKELREASLAWKVMQGAEQQEAVAAGTSAVTHAASVARVAQGVEAVADKSEKAILPLGRLRQSFSSLAAQATGTSPVIDRILSTLASFGIGNVVTIGIIAGIAGIGYAWHAMAGGMSEDAKYAEDAIKKLTEEILRARDAMGTMTTQAADTNLQSAKAALDASKAKLAALQGGGSPETTGTFATPAHPPDIFLTQAVAPADLAAAAKAVKTAQDIYDAAVKDGEHKKADNLSQLIRGNALSHAERQHAIAELQKDQAELAALTGKGGDADVARRVSLVRDISSLKDSLYPKATTGQENRADDTVTRFRDELKQLQSAATSFGKDDAIDTRMAAFVERINQAEVALRRLKKTDAAPQIAALEDVKAQVPALTEDFKTQAQTNFNTSLDERISKMQEENAAQRALTAARRESIEAVDAVMIANAGALAVEAEQERATREYLTLLPEYIARVRELAEAHARNSIEAQQPERFATNAAVLTGQAQEHVQLDTGDAKADLQQINAAYVDALDYQDGLVKKSEDWRKVQAAINALMKERKTLEVTIATKPLTDLVQPALLTQLQAEIGDAGGASHEQRQQLDAAMKASREAALVEAQKETAETVRSNKPLEEKIAILQKIHQELVEIGAIKPAPDSVLGAVVGGLHQLGDLANAFHNSGLGNLLNTAGNVVSNVNTARDVGQKSGFLSAAAFVPDVAAVTSIVALTSQIFGTNEVMQDWRNIMRQNNEALQQLTLKMQGFIPGSVDNLSAAAQALRAYAQDKGAQQQVYDNRTQKGGFFGGHFSDTAGGDLQSQINALKPYLNQAFGKTETQDQLDDEWRKLVSISKTLNITLTDAKGRIVPGQLQAFSDALNAATAAAFTLTKSFSDQNGLYTLINEANGKTDARASYNAALQAFGVAAPNALAAAGIADPTKAAGLATDNSLASENKVRQFVQSVLAQEKAAVDSGIAFDPSKFGSFTSISELNNALGTLISPLNQLTSTVNGVTDSLTHVPSGFKVAYDRFLASDRLTQNPISVPPAAFTPLPASSFPNPNAGLTGSAFTTATGLSPSSAKVPAPTPTAPTLSPTTITQTFTGNINVTMPAGATGDQMLQILLTKAQQLGARGGTSPLSLFLGGGASKGVV